MSSLEEMTSLELIQSQYQVSDTEDLEEDVDPSPGDSVATAEGNYDPSPVDSVTTGVDSVTAAEVEEKRKTPTYADAFAYLEQVKAGLQDCNKYDEFFKVMKDFKSQRIGGQDTIDRVKDVLQGHDNLILGFNAFLQKGCEITVPLDSREQPPKNSVEEPKLVNGEDVGVVSRHVKTGTSSLSMAIAASRPVRPDTSHLSMAKEGSTASMLSMPSTSNASYDPSEMMLSSQSVKIKVDPYHGLQFSTLLQMFLTSRQDYCQYGPAPDGGLQFLSPAKFEEFKNELKKKDRNLPTWMPNKWKVFQQRLDYHGFEPSPHVAGQPILGPNYVCLKDKFLPETDFEVGKKKGKKKTGSRRG